VGLAVLLLPAQAQADRIAQLDLTARQTVTALRLLARL